MAPVTAQSARSTRAKSSTPAPLVPRIVPAIPLSFARPLKPKQSNTPEETKPAVSEAKQENTRRSSTADSAAKEREQAPQMNTGDVSLEKAEDNGEATAAVESSVDASSATTKAEPVHALPAADTDRPPSATEPDRSREPLQERGQTVSREHQQAPSTSRPPRPPFELPPPFYPSTDRSTPTSTTSSTFVRPPLPNPAAIHHPQLSRNGIVFGGLADSSSSSPAPAATNGGMQYPPPPPGFMGPSFAAPPMAFQGHAHHFSEPHAPMMYPSMGAPPQGNFGFRRDQPLPPHFRPGQQWYPTNGYAQQRMGGPEPFSPHHGPTHVNGIHPLSRSGSQASSPRIPATEDMPAETNAVPDDPSRKRFAASVQNGAASRKTPVPIFQPASAQQDIDFGLRDYLRAQFGNREYADYILKLFQGEGRGLILFLPVHGLVLGRNRRLAELMASSDPSHYEGGMRVLDILIEDRFFDGPIFAETLKYLYTEDMLTTRNFVQGLPPFTVNLVDTEGFGSPPQRMRHALAYAAAGHFLQIRGIVSRGLEIATELLRWDTVEVALSFAMDGGLDATWRAEDASEDKASASSSDDASSKFDTDSAPTYGSYSTHFLQTINGFLVHNFPKDFELDTSAPPLYDMPRLPPLGESRPTSRNPRLSQIRFGDVPVDASGPSRFVVGLLSGILLSLPFPVLKALLEDFVLSSRLGRGKVAQVLQSVVEEREARRRNVLKHYGASVSERDEPPKQNLFWCERVEASPQHPSAFRLVRSRQGVDTPASTESTKSTERVD